MDGEVYASVGRWLGVYKAIMAIYIHWGVVAQW